VEELDGGMFTTPFVDDFELNKVEYYYDNTLLEPSVFSIDTPISQTYNERYDLNGRIFVRNVNTKEISLLEATFPYLSSRYNSTANSQLSAINRFDMCFDVLILETSNYLLFEKIKYENSQFVNSNLTPYIITHSTTPINRVSNRFYANNAIYYCTLNTATTAITSNDYVLYPTIYKYDTLSNRNITLFPLTEEDYMESSQFFSVSGQNVRYVKAEPPVVSYASKNNIFSISFLLKDQNDMIYMHEYDLTIADTVVRFIKHDAYRASPNSQSLAMTNTYTSSLSFYLSAGSVSINNEEFIL
jgi:hypothetical protein